MIEQIREHTGEARKRRKTVEDLQAEAREVDPELAEELKKAAAAERVDLLKAQTLAHQKSMSTAAAQIKTIQEKLWRLREELKLPPPPDDDPSIKAYKKHILELQEKIKTAEVELQKLLGDRA